MTKEEAKEAMKRGKKVSHRTFTAGEWFTERDGDVYDEEGYVFHPVVFWADRTPPAFDDRWSLFVESE